MKKNIKVVISIAAMLVQIAFFAFLSYRFHMERRVSSEDLTMLEVFFGIEAWYLVCLCFMVVLISLKVKIFEEHLILPFITAAIYSGNIFLIFAAPVVLTVYLAVLVQHQRSWA